MSRKVTVSRHGDWPVVKIHGELSGKQAQTITRRLNRICALQHRRLVVDLSETTFVDSHGLGILIHFWKCLREEKREMVFLKPQGFMKRMLDGTNLSRIFTIVDSLETA